MSEVIKGKPLELRLQTINDHFDAIQGIGEKAFFKMLPHWLGLGEEFIAIQKEHPGKWQEIAESDQIPCGIRQAQKYVRVTKQKEDVRSKANSEFASGRIVPPSIDAALGLIAKKKQLNAPKKKDTPVKKTPDPKAGPTTTGIDVEEAKAVAAKKAGFTDWGELFRATETSVSDEMMERHSETDDADLLARFKKKLVEAHGKKTGAWQAFFADHRRALVLLVDLAENWGPQGDTPESDDDTTIEYD